MEFLREYPHLSSFRGENYNMGLRWLTVDRGLTLTQTHTHVKLINLIIYLVFSVTRFTLKIIRAQSFSADYLYDLRFHLSLFQEKNRTVWTLKLKVGNYIAMLIKVNYQHST